MQKFHVIRYLTLGAPLTYFNDRGVWQRFIFYTQKNPNFRICLPKKIPTFLAYPKKSLSVFASANFIIYLLQSWNMPTSTLVLVKSKTINCAYVIFDLSWWKIQYPKKIPVLFSRPQKIPASFIDPKKSLLAKMSGQK